MWFNFNDGLDSVHFCSSGHNTRQDKCEEQSLTSIFPHNYILITLLHFYRLNKSPFFPL